MLSQARLRARVVNERTFAIEDDAAVTGDGVRVLGAVRVGGNRGNGDYGRAGRGAGVNGVNGSRDITATEGTQSYTSGALTVGSKAPQSIKDTPQAVSVLTAQRIQDQNITDITSALNQTTGVTVITGGGSGTSIDNQFFSRGFQLDNIQIDGGAPLNTSSKFNYFNTMDLSIYDHVEIERGAAGVLNGYGSPSGTINLVRKRPLDHLQVSLDLTAGSWSFFREVLDATSPLAFNGKLRGRMVVSRQDNNHFYRVAHDSQTVLYGIVEADLTPTTLLTVGATRNIQDLLPSYGGLPRYEDGRDIELPRTLCLCFPWNRIKLRTSQAFAQLDQKLGGDWTTRLSVTRSTQRSASKYGSGTYTVNPNSPALGFTGAYQSDTHNRQLLLDGVLSGSATILGQKQRLIVGASYSNLNADGVTNYGQLPFDHPIDLFNFDPYDPQYAEPADGVPSSIVDPNRQRSFGAYATLVLTAFDRLHLAGGVRYSKFTSDIKTTLLCNAFFVQRGLFGCTAVGQPYGASSGDTYSDSDFTWPPTISLLYDFTRNLTVSATYQDIYTSQASQLGVDRKPIPPVTGKNIEAAVKWQSPSARMNVSLSGYFISQQGFGVAVADPLDPTAPYGSTVVGGTQYCCFIGGDSSKQRSQGFDLDVTGALTKNLQVSLGYTFNNNEYRYYGDLAAQNTGARLQSRSPKHLLKVWTTYAFPESSTLNRLQLSFGFNGQSKSFESGSACSNYIRVPDGQGGTVATCDTYVPYQFVQRGYVILSGRVGYRISDHFNLDLNVGNLTDKRYYVTVGGTSSGNYYGEPRSVMLTLRSTLGARR